MYPKLSAWGLGKNMEKSRRKQVKMFDVFLDGVLALRMDHILIGDAPHVSRDDGMNRAWKGVERSFQQTGDVIREVLNDEKRA